MIYRRRLVAAIDIEQDSEPHTLRSHQSEALRQRIYQYSAGFPSRWWSREMSFLLFFFKFFFLTF